MTIKSRIIVAGNIRKYRNRLGFTQEKLAAKCGMHDNYISKVELGKISLGIDNLERIARALKVEPYILLKPESPLKD